VAPLHAGCPRRVVSDNCNRIVGTRTRLRRGHLLLVIQAAQFGRGNKVRNLTLRRYLVLSIALRGPTRLLNHLGVVQALLYPLNKRGGKRIHPGSIDRRVGHSRHQLVRERKDSMSMLIRTSGLRSLVGPFHWNLGTWSTMDCLGDASTGLTASCRRAWMAHAAALPACTGRGRWRVEHSDGHKQSVGAFLPTRAPGRRLAGNTPKLAWRCKGLWASHRNAPRIFLSCCKSSRSLPASPVSSVQSRPSSATRSPTRL
jgi:hypothetical protein